MAGGVGGVRSAVGVVAQCVLVLSSGVKLGGQRRVQALHAAPRAVLVWTLPEVGTARVKPTRQVGGRGTESEIIQIWETHSCYDNGTHHRFR